MILSTAFGSNQHDTESCTCAIDGGGGGVFQDRHAGHVLRVDEVGVHFHAVHQYQRVTAVDGGFTADVERRPLARLSARGDVQVGDGTLQTLTQVDDGSAFQHFLVHGGHGTCQVGLLHRGITYYHHFIQQFRVLPKDDIERLTFPFDFLGGVAHIGNLDDVARFDVTQLEVAVDVRDDTIGRAFY